MVLWGSSLSLVLGSLGGIAWLSAVLLFLFLWFVSAVYCFLWYLWLWSINFWSLWFCLWLRNMEMVLLVVNWNGWLSGISWGGSWLCVV